MWLNQVKIIPLGHRCDVTLALRQTERRQEALPFDWVISSFRGIITCFQEELKNMIPDEPNKYLEIVKYQSDQRLHEYPVFRTESEMCFIHHDLRKATILEILESRRQRLMKILKGNDQIIFLRTILDDYQSEVSELDRFRAVMKQINPQMNFKLCLIALQPNYEFRVVRLNGYPEVYFFRAKYQFFPDFFEYLENHDLFGDEIEMEVIEIGNLDKSFNRIGYGGLAFYFKDKFKVDYLKWGIEEI